MVINVYSQYFQAQASFSGVERRGALVLLISDSEAGMISYKAAVSFFPHRDAEDFAVSYDAYFDRRASRAALRSALRAASASFFASMAAFVLKMITPFCPSIP